MRYLLTIEYVSIYPPACKPIHNVSPPPFFTVCTRGAAFIIAKFKSNPTPNSTIKSLYETYRLFICDIRRAFHTKRVAKDICTIHRFRRKKTYIQKIYSLFPFYSDHSTVLHLKPASSLTIQSFRSIYAIFSQTAAR